MHFLPFISITIYNPLMFNPLQRQKNIPSVKFLFDLLLTYPGFSLILQFSYGEEKE